MGPEDIKALVAEAVSREMEGVRKELDELKLETDKWRPELERVLALAASDSDQWVSMLAELLHTFPASGSLNTDIGVCEENRDIFVDLVDDLKELMKGNLDVNLLPLECHYLNKVTFGEIPVKSHLQLRRPPRADALRAELLRRSTEAAAQLARQAAAAAAGPLRARSVPRRPADSAGVSRAALGGRADGERRRVSVGLTGPPPPHGRTVRLLDISEQPAAGAPGKRRRKATAERASASRTARVDAPEAASETAQEQETAAAVPTPEYAAGLQLTHAQPLCAAAAAAAAPVPGQPPTARGDIAAPTPCASGHQPPAVGSCPGTSAPHHHQPPGPAMYWDTQLTVHRPTCAHQSLYCGTAAGSGEQAAHTETPQPLFQSGQPGAAAVPGGAPGACDGSGGGQPRLTLTREQMLEAQEMFSSANRVTRPEKALILGFMAGSRENPCPHLGDVVTVKLSESAERLAAADCGRSATVVAETHFQMNYATGEWKRIKKFRRVDKTAL